MPAGMVPKFSCPVQKEAAQGGGGSAGGADLPFDDGPKDRVRIHLRVERLLQVLEAHHPCHSLLLAYQP